MQTQALQHLRTCARSSSIRPLSESRPGSTLAALHGQAAHPGLTPLHRILAQARSMQISSTPLLRKHPQLERIVCKVPAEGAGPLEAVGPIEALEPQARLAFTRHLHAQRAVIRHLFVKKRGTLLNGP